MPNRERRKGLEGEREVAAILRTMPATTVQNLEGQGDVTVMRQAMAYETTNGETRQAGWETRLHLHVEVKRCETARPWAWYEQARSEAPAGAVPVVAFRRSKSPWLALIELEDLARLLA